MEEKLVNVLKAFLDARKLLGKDCIDAIGNAMNMADQILKEYKNRNFSDGDIILTEKGGIEKVLIYLNDNKNFSDGNAFYFWDLSGNPLNEPTKKRYGKLIKPSL